MHHGMKVGKKFKKLILSSDLRGEDNEKIPEKLWQTIHSKYFWGRWKSSKHIREEDTSYMFLKRS